MNINAKNWLPMALCCLPGVAVAAIVAVGAAGGGAASSGPLSLGLIALAMLACPISMGVMMLWHRRSSQSSARPISSPPVTCCLPGATLDAVDAGEAAERLAALRAKREVLEQELVELSAKP